MHNTEIEQLAAILARLEKLAYFVGAEPVLVDREIPNISTGLACINAVIDSLEEFL
jgi:hypothetical protein